MYCILYIYIHFNVHYTVYTIRILHCVIVSNMMQHIPK